MVLTLDDKLIVLDRLKSETQEKLYVFNEERGLTVTKSIRFNNYFFHLTQFLSFSQWISVR